MEIYVSTSWGVSGVSQALLFSTASTAPRFPPISSFEDLQGLKVVKGGKGTPVLHIYMYLF